MASRRALGISFVTITEAGMYFPKQTAFIAGIKEGRYVHFINDGDYWAFFVNDDLDGFPVTNTKGYLICNRTLSRLFLRSVKKKLRDRFYVVPTNAEHHGNKVWEIYTKDSVDMVVEKQKRVLAQRKYVLALTKKVLK